MKNYGPLWSYPEIVGNLARNPRRSYLTLAILLTVLVLTGGAPGARATGTLTANPGSLLFGDITVGQTQTKTLSLKNSGSTAVTISGDSVIGTGYRISGISFPRTLSAGETVSFSVEFTPGQSGTVSGKLEVLSNASNSTLVVPVSGEGVVYASGYASVAPLNAPFGGVPVGTKDTEIITVMNAGKKSLTVDSVTTNAKGFSITGMTTPVSIEPGAQTHFTVGFFPEAAGSVNGSILVKSTGSDSNVTITVSGTGLASSRALSVSPTSVAFGNVEVGSSATQQISLKNTGNSSIAISGESITGTGLSEAGMGGAVTLAAGQSATMTVEFAPKSAGAVSGGVTIASNASNGTSITVPVTGAGVAASSSAKVVELSWKASTSSGVSGYYVYRGSTSGGPYTKLDSSPIAGTSYSDSSVSAGEYYYVVAAVNSDGTESAYSNQAAVSVP